MSLEIVDASTLPIPKRNTKYKNILSSLAVGKALIIDGSSSSGRAYSIAKKWGENLNYELRVQRLPDGRFAIIREK